MADETPPDGAFKALMLVPKVACFADARLADSIHGVRHNARVSLLTSVLAIELRLDAGDAAALRAAAAIHDRRRRDDRDDPGHGQRAARPSTCGPMRSMKQHPHGSSESLAPSP
ncbi:hypothetical protein [Streptacidiphilus sp. EB129]|uniref:hypothetical protein n=1 Tax=Streptacidiphilus sp. EB129 TaxID=3156262 RepID=UPI0035187EB2